MLLDIFDPKAKPRPIGIDLGTTHSLVAYVRDGKAETIADCDGRDLIPSVVHYKKEGGILVGELAKSMLFHSPLSTISSVKRFMGKGTKSSEDIELQGVSSYRFAKVEKREQDTVYFDIHGKKVSPVEISAEILRVLKIQAEEKLRGVGEVVITVPAYFDDAGRQATKDAAKLAGLSLLRLLNEPTAAALAYGLERKKNGTFVVFDLGGGTLDVTVLVLDDGVFQVKATGGDSSLGGDDMDFLVAGELHQLLESSEPIQKLASSLETRRIFLEIAKRVKHELTDREETLIPFDLLHSNSVLWPRFTFTRTRFESLIEPLLMRAQKAVRQTLKDAGVSVDEIDGVLLVGGATRVPKVNQFVSEIFKQKPLSGIDPDRVVAIGAALAAEMFSTSRYDKDHPLLLDVLPLSLGVELAGGIVDKILPRNTTIPASATSVYTTKEDGQTGFEIHVVQGEREMASDCRSLGHFLFKGIPPMLAGMARLEIHFDVDVNGILKVKAIEQLTKKTQDVEVKPSYGLDDATIERMLLDAYDHSETDLEKRKLEETRVEGQRVLLATEHALKADSQLLSQDEQEKISLSVDSLRVHLNKDDVSAIRHALSSLDEATRAFAAKRMNQAFTDVLTGQTLHQVEQDVEHALGIDEAHMKRGLR